MTNPPVGALGVPPIASPGPAQRVCFSNASLYVGDLDKAVLETELFELFSQMGAVLSVRVCRDVVTRVSLGYAYVNYTSPQEAARALDVLNFAEIHGKSIRIMYVNRDPSIRKSGLANVFIKNIDPSIDNKSLYDIFASFGSLLSCKVASDESGRSKGYGYAQFETEESAKDAIDNLNGMLVNGRKVYVGIFRRRQERGQQPNPTPRFTNVYVNNLSETTGDEDLLKIFGQYGIITSAIVMKDANGRSRCFGFVNYQNPDDAATAVAKLNGSASDGVKIWYVGRAQSRAERDAQLRAKYEQQRNERYEKTHGANLYMKNLDDDVNDEKLKDLFSEFGTITSCKVMLDSQGQSKGSGFVAFSTPQEASRAMTEMNSKLIGRKPLYVAIAQRKEERRVRLQAHFAQLRAPGVVVSTAIPSSLPGFPAGARLPAPQQLYYGQGAPAIVPTQAAGYGFQPQLIPGMRPGMAPNYMMPYGFPRQGQNGQRMGFRRGGPHAQHNHIQRNNNGFRNMQGSRNGFEFAPVPQGIVGPMVPVPLDANGMQSFSMRLASASPENQRMILGEQLYPLVEQIERDNAGKVTGMLLEMDQTEVLHLIESPEALKKKVAEAIEVLRAAQVGANGAADQLGSLSLNA